MVNIAQTIHEIRGRLLLTVHDSVCAEIPSSEVANLDNYLDRSITKHIQKTFPDRPVPMPFDVLVGKSYGETEDLAAWLS